MQCSVPFCSSKSSDASLAQGGVGVTFHEFPREAHFRAAWLRALGKQDCQLPDSAVVCSQHFAALSDVCEIEGGARQLRSDAVPSAVLVCMTCLNTDGKMFPMSQHSLRRAYEQLTGYPPCDGGYMKLTLCAQCAQYLRNFTRFREQSLRARCLMMELLEKHEVITLQHITMIQHENNHPKKNLVSTMLGPDPCDMYIADNTDEDRQTGSEETALGVAVKTECSDVSQFVNEDKQEINEENNYADCVSEELAEHPLNSESAAFVCTVCCEEFSHEHAYSAHVRTHLHDDASDSRAPDSDHTTDTELKSCVVKLYDILKYPQNAKVKVESSPPTLQTASSRDSLYAHTAREDAQHRAASEDEVAATHEEPAASVLSGTEPGTSGSSSLAHTLTCHDCQRVFSGKHNLIAHMWTHTGEKPYSCKLCSYKFTEKRYLVTHMRTHTDGTGNPYSCKLCSYKFTEKRHLVTHMRSHTGEKPYSFKLCSYKCTRKSSLDIHMRIHTGEKPYSCKLCSYKCIDTSRLYRHMKIHTSEKPYSCELCSYKCTEKRHLVPHMANHTGEKPYSCVICSYKCTEKNRLVRHIRTHTGEKPYSCKLCSYKCIDTSRLYRHMKIHTSEKPYSCELCSYKCTEKRHLVPHMANHTGEKPYSCVICSYKCTEKNRLVRHIRTHTGEKPYSCKLCSYKSIQKDKLMLHMRTHTGEKPYSCNLCNFKFTQKGSLNRHMRVHTGEKPYSCKLCSYKCTEKGNLVFHSRTHTGERPYSCILCPYKYSKKSNLMSHMKIHFNE